jgi:hypothetical protein
MADDPVCVRQLPYPVAPLHPPADDRTAPARGVVPARGVAQGVGGVKVAARGRISQALHAYDESHAGVVHAEELWRDAAGPARKYPNIAIAEGAYRGANDILRSSLKKSSIIDILQRLGNLQKAAKDLHEAWALARDDARKGSDAELQEACDAGFRAADLAVQHVNDPAFGNAWVKRAVPVNAE